MPADGANLPDDPPPEPHEIVRALETRIEQLREEARRWGVHPDLPEGAFASAMIGVLAELGVVAQRMMLGNEASASKVTQTLAGWEEKGSRNLGEMFAVAGDMRVGTRELRETIAGFQKKAAAADLPGIVEAQIGPAIGNHLRTSLDRQLTLRNRAESLKHWAGVVAISFVIFVGGWITGLSTRQPSDVERAVAGCEVNPIVSGGQSFCALRSLRTFVPPG